MTRASTTARLTDRSAVRLHRWAGHAIARLERIITRLDHAAAHVATPSGSLSGSPVDRRAASGSPLTTHLPASTGPDQAKPGPSGSVDTPTTTAETAP
ncbi:hypothetical protein GCM10022222_40240 [Amycolatopsis ultiminotia]|uniref:Uncharacterized protein n=1 Tax=Amycolatopsis ultiminotia TaxID=543629 RepID=A0ABP6WP93_9PSEU